MKFKTFVTKEFYGKGPISCLDWSNTDEVYSCSDDHNIFKWNSNTRESVQVARLPDDFFPTDLHLLISKYGGSGSNKGNDSLLITSNDGRFIILNKSARVERNVVAHNGPVTTGRWSPDAAGLLTAGEDGVLKIWSRSGMLRSTVVQNEIPIRCARWSPNSSSIAYCQDGFITIKPLVANSKVVKWKAHDGLILCLSWSNKFLLASGGEDCRYKIWDSQGAIIYSSTQDDYSITSVDFCPDGQLLAVGGFNSLKLCDYSGWVHGINRFSDTNFGSLFAISWSPDGTQIIAGCGSGALIFGNIIEKQLISRNLKATTVGRRTIELQDILAKTTDVLEISDRIINMELGYGHLIVVTAAQVHIFNENYINTPIIIDGRNDVRIISLGKKNFLLVDNSSIWVYTYTGRLHLNPRFPGSPTQISNLNAQCISLGLDILAIRDYADQSIIHLFDLLPGASRQDEPYSIESKTQIMKIAVCRAGNPDDQYLVFIDVNRDLFITSVRSNPEFTIYKIGTQVLSVIWGSESNILVAMHDSCYTIWYCPGEACTDPTLIALTTVTMDTTEFEHNVCLENFEGSIISFRSSGALYTISVKIYCDLIHKFIQDGMWNQALKVCRMAQSQVLWATLAAMASKKNQLTISEEAYSASLQIDKVYYLQHIRNLPNSSSEQIAENSIFNGRTSEAEIILVHNKKIKEAIAVCIRMHDWEKALEIACKHKMDIDYVLEERKKYLRTINRDEMNQKYIAFENKNLLKNI